MKPSTTKKLLRNDISVLRGNPTTRTYTKIFGNSTTVTPGTKLNVRTDGTKLNAITPASQIANVNEFSGTNEHTENAVQTSTAKNIATVVNNGFFNAKTEFTK